MNFLRQRLSKIRAQTTQADTQTNRHTHNGTRTSLIQQLITTIQVNAFSVTFDRLTSSTWDLACAWFAQLRKLRKHAINSIVLRITTATFLSSCDVE